MEENVCVLNLVKENWISLRSLFSGCIVLQWLQMDRISPLKLLEENKILGGFALKQMLFRHHCGQHCDVVFEAWRELTRLLSQKKIEPIVDSEWSFEEVGLIKQASHACYIYG